MARINRYGCPQPPLAPEQAALATLLEDKALLEQQLASAVLEIEQPSQGRTTFRSVPEMERQLAIINGRIAGMTPSAADQNAWRKVRRRLYPTVY